MLINRAEEQIAIELELRPKGASRTRKILNNLMSEGHIDRVIYYARQDARRLVDRLIDELGFGSFIETRPWTSNVFTV